MNTADPDRLGRLERRVAELERRAGVPAAEQVHAVAAESPTIVAAAPPVIAAAAIPPTPPPLPTRTRSLADLEEQLSSRLLAWVGGIALVLGSMFFLSLAFSRGWIGPEARVLIGLVGGAVALAAGAWLFDRGGRTPALVLTGVGVGVGSLALFAASRLYGFIPAEPALIGFAVIAVTTAAIALRANSQAVAAFGILATTLAPPILGAEPTLATVAFLGAAVVGIAVVSVRRVWPWHALLAFLVVAPQQFRWLSGEPSLALALVGIAAFWGVNALAAAGPALADVRPRVVHRASASLLALNALLGIGALHTVLSDDHRLALVAIAVLAGLHAVLALPLLLRGPRRHPFGVLAAGLAAGTLAAGIGIELGGHARPIGETLLAAIVAWVGIRFRERVAAWWAGVIGCVAVVGLVVFEYPYETFGAVQRISWPFATPEGLVAIAMAAALAIIGVIARRSFRATPLDRPGRWTPDLALVAASLGSIAVIAYAAGFELPSDLRVVGWSMLAAISLGVSTVVRRDRVAWLTALTGSAVVVASAAMLALVEVVPPARLAVDLDRVGAIVPLLNRDSLALAALAAVLAAAGIVASGWSPASRMTGGSRDIDSLAGGSIAAAAAVAVYLVSVALVDGFQTRLGGGLAPEEVATQAQVALSILWVLVGAGSFAVGLIRRVSLARLFGLGLLSVATVKVFVFDLAGLDVAYRVLSFIGLGGVLLASSFVAARFRDPGRSTAT